MVMFDLRYHFNLWNEATRDEIRFYKTIVQTVHKNAEDVIAEGKLCRSFEGCQDWTVNQWNRDPMYDDCLLW